MKNDSGGDRYDLPPSYFPLSSRLLLQPEFLLHAQHEILGPPRGGDDAVGHRFTQLFLCCSRLLRDREVLGQSVRTPDRHRTPNPDQFAGLDIQDLLVLEIENLLAHLHDQSSLLLRSLFSPVERIRPRRIRPIRPIGPIRLIGRGRNRTFQQRSHPSRKYIRTAGDGAAFQK